MDLTTYGFDDNYESYEESMEGLKDVLTNFLNNRQNKIFDTKGYQNVMNKVLRENDKLRNNVRLTLDKYEKRKNAIPDDLSVLANPLRKSAAKLFTLRKDIFATKYLYALGLAEMINRYKDKLDMLTQERIYKTDLVEEAKEMLKDVIVMGNDYYESEFTSWSFLSLEDIRKLWKILNHTLSKAHSLNKPVADLDNFIRMSKDPELVKRLKTHPYINNKFDSILKDLKEVRLIFMKYIQAIAEINKGLNNLLKSFNIANTVAAGINKLKPKRTPSVATESLESEIDILFENVICNLSNDIDINLENYGII